ncbi:PAS-domain containing protein [Acidisphaera sp. S103]|uniref:PAS-domain containing protein n=1 Tax=Acidisphaera sp. S103 TaxID=1747223 RepID=UPI00131B7CF5|nr:PAS-domain containing protein [Acidisphaera sp. S103]
MTERVTVSLETVFDAIPVGLNVVDADRRIVLMNRAFRESLGLRLDPYPPGTLVEDAVRAAVLRGVYGPGDPESQVRAVMAVDHGHPGRLRRCSFAGRTFDLFNTPLPDGGYVVTAVESTGLLADRADAENALAQTATALTTLRIGLAVFDSQRRLSLVNPRFPALLALPPDRVVAGFSFVAMLTLMETREEFAGPDGLAFIASLRDAAPGISWNHRLHRADGRSIDVMFDALPDGGCAISVSDITPQARAEDEAYRRAHLLDLVLLNIPHGICVYGPDHRITKVNDTYNRVMEGAPVRIGDHRSDLIRQRAEAGEYGEGVTETVIAVQVAYDTSRPQRRRRVRPNGTAIDVRTAPLPDGGHISVVTDITELVQAEAEVRRRAEDMSTMLGNIRHGIMLWGPDRILVASNPVATELLDLPADLLTPGRPEAEVIAALSERGHFGSGDEVAKRARMLLHLDRTTPFGREIATRSGRVLHAQSNPAPGGGWISTFSDITKMRETESELRRAKELAEAANQAKSRFLATMSHELRTPLNAIIGFSDALARENGDVPAKLVAEYSGQINEAGKQLLSLINIILDVAGIESGRFEAGAESVDIVKAIHAAVRQADSAAQAGEVAIELALPDTLPWLRGDERRISQALSQILSNAVKFTKAGGSITVEGGLTPEADLFVSVTDTGIGIPAAALERVFEPFTQLDGSLSRRYPGAGLGLFTARAIAMAHGGQLHLASRAGEGTSVRIILPGSRILNPEGP